MAFLGNVLERTKANLSSSSASRSRIGFLMIFGCAVIAFSLYGVLVVENSQSWSLANLFLGIGLLLERAAVLSYADQPTLAALLRLTSITTIILFVTVAGIEILYF